MKFSLLKNFHSTQNNENFLREYYLPIVLYVANIWSICEIDENIAVTLKFKISANENNANYGIML